MKIRLGFVSNSSSSSFLVSLSVLNPHQIESLEEHCSKPIGHYGDGWNVSVNYSQNIVEGCTYMRNNEPGQSQGDLEDWLRDNSFPVHLFKFEND